MSRTLQEIITRRAELAAERASAEAAHAAFLKASAAELAQLREAESIIVGGLDLGKIERGRQLLNIYGRVALTEHGMYNIRSGVRDGALGAAKNDLAAGGDKIVRQYFGVKNYSGFGDQREDHEYGMGPRHGDIVFSIALTREARDQIKSGQPLLDEQIDAALYLLSALPKIEELQANAKVAA